jgi:hypothetical protein
VVAKIESLTREPGFVYTLALILMRDLFLTPEDIAEINPREHLNIQELTFLVGLLVKSEIDFTVPSEDQSAQRFELTYELFEDLHRKYHEPFIEEMGRLAQNGRGNETREENYRRIFGAGTAVSEPIFYAASGAYDFQYLDLAVDKYQHDSAWIKEHIGVDVRVMAEIARELKRLHEVRFNDLIDGPPAQFSDMCQGAFSIFCFEEKDLGQFGTAEVVAFLKAFSLTPGEANAKLQLPGQFNELQSKPIIDLRNGKYFFPIGFNLSEAIYEAPFYWMNTDSVYRPTALANRGNFAASATEKLLRNVFGADRVYMSVEIREKKGHTVTDIDVLAIVGNKAVVAQVKSKRLTELARLGDQKSLLADFEFAIQEAYDQGLISRKAIVDRENRLFVGGAELHLDEAIDDVYILCVTLDYYPAVTHQVDVYLKKSPSDPVPVALSVFDLDVIAFYLSDPFEFAYYLRQRIALSSYFKADSEMVLLGLHLKRKLFKSGNATMEVLDGSFAQLIDANFQVLRGSVPRTDAADKLRSKWKNEDFQELIEQIKSTKDPRFTDAIFFLYDLAGKGADDTIKVLKLTKRKTQVDQQPHDARLPLTEFRGGITILCEPSSLSILRNKLLGLAEVAKYKSDADLWLGLGCLGTSGRLVDAVVFANYEWRYDPKLETLAAQLQGKLMAPDGRKIGRNEPCPCKSGKKFKRCCGR